MPKKLLNLYVRTLTGAARFAYDATKFTLDAALGVVRGGEASEPPAPAPAREPEPAPASVSDAPAVDYDAEPLTPIDPEAERVKTMDDEDELVGEFADPGAEDGPGATIEVEPPWDGYEVMHADDVIARIGAADEAEIAVLELYERAHKGRQTVLAAAEQRLRELANLQHRA